MDRRERVGEYQTVVGRNDGLVASMMDLRNERPTRRRFLGTHIPSWLTFAGIAFTRWGGAAEPEAAQSRLNRSTDDGASDGQAMVERIESWIESTNRRYQAHRVPCSIMAETFRGFYSAELLARSYFVPVPELPKPEFFELRAAGMGDFLDRPFRGITYNNTYYLLAEHAGDMSLHFHELVHVAQWQLIGVSNFIRRYIDEIQKHGYDRAPLEVMSFELEEMFVSRKDPVDVVAYVKQRVASAPLSPNF